jgi:hypothetical protein
VEALVDFHDEGEVLVDEDDEAAEEVGRTIGERTIGTRKATKY